MYFKRDLQELIASEPVGSKAILILGARRVGKTTLLRHLEQRDGDTLWINADMPADARMLDFDSQADVQNLLNSKSCIVIDEAQKVESIGLKLKMLVDVNELREHPTALFVTGSSALELSGGVAESAVGRLRQFHLYPLSMQEIAQEMGQVEAKRSFPERLLYGMYPAVVSNPELARETLEDYCAGMLFKDVFSLSGLRKPKPFMDLVIRLAQSIGSKVSYDNLAPSTGLSRQTVCTYIDLLEQTHIVRSLSSFSRNPLKELQKGKKIYFVDLGVRNCLLRDFSPLTVRTDAGALWENFFFMERVKWHEAKRDFARQYFWRTKENAPKEVDFLEEEAGKLQAFECKYASQAKARAPKAFKNAYPEVPFHTITPKTIWPWIGL